MGKNKTYTLKYWYEFHGYMKVKAKSEDEAFEKINAKLSRCCEGDHPDMYNEYQNEKLELKDVDND